METKLELRVMIDLSIDCAAAGTVERGRGWEGRKGGRDGQRNDAIDLTHFSSDMR